MNHCRIAATFLIALTLGATACSSDSKSSDSTAAPTTATPATEAAATTEAVETTEAAATTEAVETTEAPDTTEVATTEAPETTEAPTTTEAPAAVLEVLVTNDDGYDAPGIDAVVEYLRTRDDVNITVWAPLTNQSGSGDKSTEGGATNITDVTTASGYPAKAVEGFPADSVNAALASGYAPDLIISGSNLGQNYGPLTTVSGTVGAAATGARLDIPSIAISQGVPGEGGEFDFPSSVAVLAEYLDGAIEDYVNGFAPILVTINVPTCPVGVALLPTLDDVALASGDNGRQLLAPTLCDGNPATPADDIDAFNAGHPTVVQLDPTTLGDAA